MAMLAAASRPSLKIILLSSCVLSFALLLHFCLPAIPEFVMYQIPSMYTAVATWLRPLYLYILVNCIILSIVASSKLHHVAGSADGYTGQSPVPVEVTPKAVPVEVAPKAVGISLQYAENQSGHVCGEVEDLVVVTTARAEKKVALVEEASLEEAAVADVEVSDPTVEPNRTDSTKFTVTEGSKDKENCPEIVKQSFSGRFDHGRSTKSSSEDGKSSKMTRQNGTLESTWRRITNGRAAPPMRRLKKSDTWRDTHAQRGSKDENTPPPPSKMKKSETFKDNTSFNKEGTEVEGVNSGKLWEETLMGQDELNRRVEAFIRKFNEGMRLEREESLNLNQFQEMIFVDRGSG